MEFKFVISDPKTGKSYQKAVNNEWFIGKKIGDKVEGNLIGLKNFELLITGGSDKAGFPMRKGVDISGRKKILSGKGTGVKVKGKGARIRKTVRGSVISDQIAQINLKIEKHGTENIDALLGKKEEPKTAP
ncbi:MAG: 30S ribosomal protein S6e [Nanoarchaeota archaeon]